VRASQQFTLNLFQGLNSDPAKSKMLKRVQHDWSVENPTLAKFAILP
jgi:hypothetical protein